jgi:orotate phosphoribosyltransferase
MAMSRSRGDFVERSENGENVDMNTENLPALSPTLERLRDLVLEHSVKTGTFTLKSGATSDWFLDAKQTACRPDGVIAITDAVIEAFGDDFADIDAIGGLTMGGDPVAYGVQAVAATRGHTLRSFSVRKEAKQGGITGRIAGALQPGDRVLVTEDTTTRGTSLIEAADQISAFGAHPVFMTVIVDRGGTCAAMAAEAGIDYRPLLTAPDLGFGFGT